MYKSIILLLAISMVSCESFVDLDPISEITGSSFWTSADDAEAGVISAYNRLQLTTRKEFGGLHLWGSARGDELMSSGSNLVDQWFDNTLTSTAPRGVGWEDWYVVINQANLVLLNVPDISMNEDQKTVLLAEARFLRAMAYFWLVRSWGDVPLIVEPVLSADEDLKPTRTPKDQVYAQIEEDLNFAVANLPATRTGVQMRSRATVGATKAMQLDYYLWMARVEGGGAAELNNAIQAARDILNDPNYALVDDYASIFGDRESEEVVFSIHYDAGNQEVGNLGGDCFPGEFGGKNFFSGSKKLYEAFEPGDVRKDASLHTIPNTGPNFIESDGLQHFLIKYLDGEPYDAFGERNFDRSVIIYRVGGIKLMLAEALNESGDTPGAIIELNDIRARAGLPPTTATTQEEVSQAILDEGLVESSFEFSRWFALIRSGRVMEEVDVINTNVFSNDSELVLPISDASLRQNENLVQNEHYQ